MNDKAIRAQQWPPQLYSIPILPSVFSVITSKSNCDVRLNSSLITPWTSPSGVFYSRSRTLSPCLLFGLPIWYAKPAGSTANLTSKGIAVYNHKGHRMWQRPEHNTIASVSCCLVRIWLSLKASEPVNLTQVFMIGSQMAIWFFTMTKLQDLKHTFGTESQLYFDEPGHMYIKID
ncbi:hypothetical protein JHK87_034793 [Glycine soja]|nr:hypothetical protein JHK87_034793 [Glycine soja]